MQSLAPVMDNAFAVLSFLAAPAILTNASTLLALSTSNRLARAADRARSASAFIVASKSSDDPLVAMQQDDFHAATQRSVLLIRALRRFYLAAGCFALGTCVALMGAFAGYFHVDVLTTPTQVLTMLVAAAGVGGLVHGAWTLLAETTIALRVLEKQHAAITTWRATHTPPVRAPQSVF